MLNNISTNSCAKEGTYVEHHKIVDFDLCLIDEYISERLLSLKLYNRFRTLLLVVISFLAVYPLILNYSGNILNCFFDPINYFFVAILVLAFVGHKHMKKRCVLVANKTAEDLKSGFSDNYDLYVYNDKLIFEHLEGEEVHRKYLLFEDVKKVIKTKHCIAINDGNVTYLINRKYIPKNSKIYEIVHGALYKRNIKLPKLLTRFFGSAKVTFVFACIAPYSAIVPIIVTGNNFTFLGKNTLFFLAVPIFIILHAFLRAIKGNYHIVTIFLAIIGIFTLISVTNTNIKRLEEAKSYKPMVEKVEDLFDIDIPDNYYVDSLYGNSTTRGSFDIHLDKKSNKAFNEKFSSDARVLDSQSLNEIYQTYFLFVTSDIAEKGEIGIIYNPEDGTYNTPYISDFPFMVSSAKYVIIVYDYSKQVIYVKIYD